VLFLEFLECEKFNYLSKLAIVVGVLPPHSHCTRKRQKERREKINDFKGSPIFLLVLAAWFAPPVLTEAAVKAGSSML
jgi:hypothetical protein